MPFGSTSPSLEIDSAIQRAWDSGKVMMAASGNRRPGELIESYPAANSNVIAIFSTDGRGIPSAYNLQARASRKNFSTLGESVPGFWKSTGPGNPFSGTSMAVHVAAALVCTAVKYANSVVLGDSSDRQKLFGFDGVEALLNLMSVPRNGLDYVAPWNLWSEERDSEQVRTLIQDTIRKLPDSRGRSGAGKSF